MIQKLTLCGLVVIGLLGLGCNGNPANSHQTSNDVNALTSESVKMAKSQLDPVFNTELKPLSCSLVGKNRIRDLDFLFTSVKMEATL